MRVAACLPGVVALPLAVVLTLAGCSSTEGQNSPSVPPTSHAPVASTPAATPTGSAPTPTISPAPTPTSPTPTEPTPTEPTPTERPTVQPGAAPEILGEARFRETLRADAPPWGPGRVELSYRWLRGGSPIRDATGITYRLVAADIGQRIRVEVSGSRAGYQTASRRSAAIGPVQPGQLNPTTPVVTGAARVGERLTGTVDPWGPGAVRLAWQWFRDDSAISGATGTTYRLVAADRGRTIRLRIRGSAANFDTATRFSQRTGVVDPGRLDPTPVPLYSGVAEVGRTITALPGEWGPGTVTLRYQWFRSGSGDGAAIKGATKEKYRTVVADVGRKLRVEVTGSRTGFTTVRRTSGWTYPISEGELQGTTPVIEGLPIKGGTLTVDPGDWGPGSVDLTIRWYRSGLLLTRALDEEYELGEDDVGHTFVARVIGTREGFRDLILESEEVGPVTERER